MRAVERIGWVLALVVAAATATTAAAGEPSADAAQAAYDAKQWGRCAELWTAVAAARSGERAVDPLYNAACCQALNGKVDPAFAMLDRAAAAGLRDVDNLKTDRDLASLHGDARWPRLIATIEKNVAAWEKTLGAPALRRELLAMEAEDQKARMAAVKSGFKDKALVAQVGAVDARNLPRLEQIVAAHGWPGKSLVGKDGAFAAWLLVQHADRDVAFQKLCLAKMEPLVQRGEVEAKSYAYLVDRVAVAEKRKQVYGTQFNDKREPQPIEDEAHVDERRKAVGLPSMAEYRKQMIRMYGPPSK